MISRRALKLIWAGTGGQFVPVPLEDQGRGTAIVLDGGPWRLETDAPAKDFKGSRAIGACGFQINSWRIHQSLDRIKVALSCGQGQRGFSGSGIRKTRIHVPSDSPFVLKHHANWRMQAIQALDRTSPHDLHYSAVMSVSRDAAEKIRKILLNAIQESEPVIREAKDEGAFALTLDLFDLKQGP